MLTGIMKWTLAIPAACALLQAADPSLRDWLQQVAFRQLEARRQAVAAISTPEQAQSRAKMVRSQLFRFIGELPHERTPLNLRRRVAVDRGEYRIENLTYESQPRFYVTANLYVPSGPGPFPAVLQPVGHSLAAKAREFYQTLSLGLVKSGFVVLTYDPLGQGERRVFYDSGLGDSKVGGTTVEHQMLGIQNLLAGESVARDMVWDGMRSIDVLESLPEVRRGRIGVAGCSGGGTLTAYLAALDDRIQVAAPACYITAWEEQLPGTGPQDAEQQFPDQLKVGLDHADFAIAFAPKPYLQVNTQDDFFPIAGAKRAFEEAKRIYTVLGAPDRMAWAVGPGGHGMPQNVREAIYGWMNHWLKDGPAGPLAEPSFQTEYEETLYCTPTGQLATSLGGETASSLNIRRYGNRRPPREHLANAAGLDALRKRVVSSVARLTRYRSEVTSPGWTRDGEDGRDRYTIESGQFAVSGGRRVPALLALPAQAKGKPIIVVTDRGARDAMRAGGDGDELAASGHVVLALDLAGFGATATKWSSYAPDWFGPDKLAWLAVMTGEPLVGLGIEDIRGGVELLMARGLAPDGCSAFAKGITGIALLHAAAVDPRIGEVVIENNLISYEAVAGNPVHRGVMVGIVPGALGVYDLTDLAASLAGRPLTLLALRTPAGPIALLKDVREAYGYARQAYQAAGAEEQLRIGLRKESERIESAYPGWR